MAGASRMSSVPGLKDKPQIPKVNPVRSSPKRFTILSAITNTQLKYGSDVMLSKNKINAELLYNKYELHQIDDQVV